ncbi:MAG: hypothetical protein ACOX6J_06500 [Oscillospiraceae bacterium]|jgi:uncharacterized membrane protein
MKKVVDRKIIIWLAAFGVLAVDLITAGVCLERLNVLTYMLAIGLLPLLTLFICGILYGRSSDASKSGKYFVSVFAAVLFSIVLMIFCSNLITEDVIAKIIENSMTSQTMQVSMTEGTVLDNVISFIMLIASSVIGCLIGCSIRKRKEKKTKAATGDGMKEYD